MNAAILEAYRDQGDPLTRVRDIEHWAYFPNAESRAHFVEMGLAAGLRLRGTRDPQGPGESYSVCLFHHDVPDEICIEQVTSLLVHLAEKAGGDYDGWETEVIQRGH